MRATPVDNPIAALGYLPPQTHECERRKQCREEEHPPFAESWYCRGRRIASVSAATGRPGARRGRTHAAAARVVLCNMQTSGWPDEVVAPTLLHEKLVSAWLIVGPLRLIDATRSPAGMGRPTGLPPLDQNAGDGDIPARVCYDVELVRSHVWIGARACVQAVGETKRHQLRRDIRSSRMFGPKGGAVVNEPVIDMADV